MPMLRQHSLDQLNVIKNKIKKQGGDISDKVKDKYTRNTLDSKIQVSDDMPSIKTDTQLKHLPKNSLITKFEKFINELYK